MRASGLEGRFCPRLSVSLAMWLLDEDPLVSGFASVANRQYHDLFSVVVIQGSVRSASEFNHPFAELGRHFFDRPAHLRMPGQRLYTLTHRLYGALGGVPALGCKKIM